jgi:hypothetical protein
MRALRRSLSFAFLLAGTLLCRAAGGGFISTLGAAEQESAGLTRLTADEQVALNALVAREVTLARQGGVSAFAGTFTSRRKAGEKAAAGLDLLSAAETAVLDRLVAAAIAAVPEPVTTAQRRRAEEFARQKRFETHGEVSLVYGRGPGGRDLMGGSVYAETYDRDTGVSLGVGVSRYEGSGLGWPCEGEYLPPAYGFREPFRRFRGPTVCRPH